MLKEMSFVRRWAIQRSPLEQPQIVALDIPHLAAEQSESTLVGQIELPLLSVPGFDATLFAPLAIPDHLPDLSQIPVQFTAIALTPLAQPALLPDLTEIVTQAIPVAFALDERSVPAILADLLVELPAPETLSRPLTAMDKLPEILDLFTGLTMPGKAGKSYSELTPPQQPSLFTQPERPLPSQERSTERCKHGLKLWECTYCNAPRATVKRPKPQPSTKAVRTLDVFDLLLPYLQPPLDQLLAQPVLFPTERRPRDYQITGIKFLAERQAALLGDEMGLGKTIQTIIALQILYRRGAVRQTLILCPRSLLGTWEKEVRKWAPELFIQKVRGTKEERQLMWQAASSVYLTTYETLREDIKTQPALSSKFQVIILDEVQKIKNPTTDTSHAVKRIRAHYRWGLSGTPLENKVEDVTAIYSYLLPSLFKPDEVPEPARVKKKIDPYFLRRRTADVIKELPEKISEEIWLELTTEQRKAYQLTEEKGKARLAEANVTRVHVFALISELKQICNIEPESGTSCKLDYLLEQFESIIESGQKALLFSHLPKATLLQLKPKLEQFAPAIFDGSLTDKQREAIINNFQQHERPKVLLISLKAGGVGLTLTAASHVFHFDHWWNPAIARQAEGRAHRIGQQKTVFVYDIYTVDTIEERIYKLLQKKQALFDAVIDDLSADYVQGSVTEEELFGLFDLQPPAEPSARTGAAASPPKRSRSQAQPAPAEQPVARPSAAKSKSLPPLSPPQFEQFVADLYTRMGYKTRVTQQSRDQGIDVIAQQATAMGMETVIIQCKHYPSGTVGEPDVRNLLGAWQEYRQAQRAVLVTSGRFSAGAIALAGKHQIKLIDQQELLQLDELHR